MTDPAMIICMSINLYEYLCFTHPRKQRAGIMHQIDRTDLIGSGFRRPFYVLLGSLLYRAMKLFLENPKVHHRTWEQSQDLVMWRYTDNNA